MFSVKVFENYIITVHAKRNNTLKTRFDNEYKNIIFQQFKDFLKKLEILKLPTMAGIFTEFYLIENGNGQLKLQEERDNSIPIKELNSNNRGLMITSQHVQKTCFHVMKFYLINPKSNCPFTLPTLHCLFHQKI